MLGLLTALGFLTVIPIPPNAARAADLGRAAAWFPLVGLSLGGVVAAAFWGFSALFPPLVAAALTVLVWAALTGGLHLDGLADCGDGLLAAASPERRLEIMRDPRVGAFGALALSLHLSLKVAAVAALPAASGLIALPAAAALARWLIVALARQPAARPSGLGAAFATGLTGRAIAAAALIPLVLIGLGVLAAPRLVLAAALTHLAALGIARAARARLGGVTGDVLGLTVEAAETLTVLAFVARWPG